jgi:hypothetical protein
MSTATADPRVTDGPVFGFYDSERTFGPFQDIIGTFRPTADSRTANGPFTFGIDDVDRIVESFDDSVERYGFFDGLGTFATLTDTRAGGAALAVRINYRGQIVGTFHGRIGGPEWLAVAPASNVSGPYTLPLLAGGVLALAMAARRRFRISFSMTIVQSSHVRRRRSTRLQAWMRA